MNRVALLTLCALVLTAGCREESGSQPPMDQRQPTSAAVERQAEQQQAPEVATEQQEEELDAAQRQGQAEQSEQTAADAGVATGVIERLSLDSPERGVVEVSWDAVEPAPADYWVSWARVERFFPPPTAALGNAFSTETSHTIRGLIPGARYKVRVRTRYGDLSAPDSTVLGRWSQTFRVRVIAPPHAPTGLRAEATQHGIILKWHVPRDDSIVRFPLVRTLRNTDRVDRFWLDGTETSYLDTRAAFDAPYDYVLHSINQDGRSPPSEPVFVRALPKIPDREYLYERIRPPMAPAYALWHWEPGRARFQELVIDFTIHTDPGDWSDRNGYFLILMQADIAGVGFYFGLQTDIDGVKGAVYSRWETRDLSLARFDADEGWTQSSGHEGDFIGVRRSYEWGVGDYRARIAREGADSEGAWFSAWVTDRRTGVTTWIGSLKFPLHRGSAGLRPTADVTIELYGEYTRPIDAPAWHVSVDRLIGDGASPIGLVTKYPYDASPNALFNSNVRYDEENDRVHLTIGAITERQDPAAAYVLE